MRLEEAISRAFSVHRGDVLTSEVIEKMTGFILWATQQADDNSLEPGRFAPTEYHGVTFQVERIRDCLDEIKVLHAAHWNETEGYRDELGFCPDYASYQRIERDGSFILFTARMDGRLVGNLMYLVHTSRHTSQLNAVEDAFYLLPEARRGMTALKFMRYAVSILDRLGCTQIGMSSKLTNAVYPEKADIRPLLKRAGFRHVAEFHTLNLLHNLMKGARHETAAIKP